MSSPQDIRSPPAYYPHQRPTVPLQPYIVVVSNYRNHCHCASSAALPGLKITTSQILDSSLKYPTHNDNRRKSHHVPPSPTLPLLNTHPKPSSSLLTNSTPPTQTHTHLFPTTHPPSNRLLLLPPITRCRPRKTRKTTQNPLLARGVPASGQQSILHRMHARPPIDLFTPLPIPHPDTILLRPIPKHVPIPAHLNTDTTTPNNPTRNTHPRPLHSAQSP